MNKTFVIYNLVEKEHSFQIGAIKYAQGKILCTYLDSCKKDSFLNLWKDFLFFVKITKEPVGGILLNKRQKIRIRHFLRNDSQSISSKIFLHDTSFLNCDYRYSDMDALEQIQEVLSVVGEKRNLDSHLGHLIRNEKRFQYALKNKAKNISL